MSSPPRMPNLYAASNARLASREQPLAMPSAPERAEYRSASKSFVCKHFAPLRID